MSSRPNARGPSRLNSDITNQFQETNDSMQKMNFDDILNVTKENVEDEMFRLCKVQYDWKGLALRQMVVSNNILVLVMSNNHIRRIDLAKPLVVEDFEVSKKPSDQIHKAFLDFSGRHLWISMTSGDNYYMHITWKRPKILSRIKSLVVDYIAWLRVANDSIDVSAKISTGPILLANGKGIIYETEIEPNDEYFKKEERYFRQVHSVSIEDAPLTGLYASHLDDDSSMVYVILTTLNRIFQYRGNIGDGKANSAFEMIFQTMEPKFQELPGELHYSDLQFVLQDFEGIKGLPKSFAWLCGAGICYGDIAPDVGTVESNDSIFEHTHLLPFPAEVSSTNPEELVVVPPQGMLCMQFHFLLFYKNRIRAICKLSDEIIWDDMLDVNVSDIVRFTADPIKNTYWIYTTSSIFEIIVVNEDRNVWKLLLDKKQFESALEHCKTEGQRDICLRAQADHYFGLGRFQLAATYYAQSLVSFEEIVLKFMDLKNDFVEALASEMSKSNELQSDSAKYAATQAAIQDALRTYVLEKFKRLSPEHATQRTLLATWIVNMYLRKLNAIENDTNGRLKGIQEEFYQWLSSSGLKESLDPQTTYQQCLNYGRTEEMIFYAKMIEDYDRVLVYYIQQQEWKLAIENLGKQDELDLYYKYSPILVQKLPYETVNLWIRNVNLNPKHLIPALLKYRTDLNPDGILEHQGIRYLEYAIKKLGNRDEAVHNLLLSFYVTRPNNESTLIAFLKAEERHFDLQYALRLCRQYNRLHACVIIYGALELYEEAVNLALQHDDLELACINADKPMDDEALRKRLWIRILQYLIQERGDLKKGLEYLKMCDLVTIEDALPFFPDYVVIDDFKDHILSALEEYKITMEELRSDMDDATRAAEQIRVDLRELKKKYVKISASENCAICSVPLFIRGFYIFPCLHHFHIDCLTVHMVKEYLTKQQQQKLVRLQEWFAKTNEEITVKKSQWISSSDSLTASDPKLAELDHQMEPRAPLQMDSLDTLRSLRRSIVEAIEELVASECIYCGELMLKTVDKPFFSEEEHMLAQSWDVLG